MHELDEEYEWLDYEEDPEFSQFQVMGYTFLDGGKYWQEI
jgi:hypothetical protein